MTYSITKYTRNPINSTVLFHCFFALISKLVLNNLFCFNFSMFYRKLKFKKKKKTVNILMLFTILCILLYSITDANN